MTLQEFIDATGLVLTSQPTDRNPHMEDSGRMDNYKVKLRAKELGTMRLYFSKGFGHQGQPPELDEVLECLASDAAGIENSGSFEGWCGEYGYDTDSRRAARTYNNTERQADRLKQFLGEDYYQQLLWEVQR